MLQFYLSLVETDEERSFITELYTTYEQKMYRIAFGVLHDSYRAEDAVHEAFLKIIDKMSQLTFDGNSKTYALLTIIVRNIAINMYNKEKKAEPIDVMVEILPDNNSLAEYQRLEETTAQEAIERLPVELREVIVMRYILEVDVKTIASTLGIAVSSVYARLQKAKELMRQLVDEINERDR